MMMKFKIEDIDEGSGEREDDANNSNPEYITNNKWYKENCRGIPRPTAFLAERSK